MLLQRYDRTRCLSRYFTNGVKSPFSALWKGMSVRKGKPESKRIMRSFLSSNSE